ncbi:hypothetical protein MIND_00928100 [Mycena indigotica]|uniref:Uncharacterized protein n=1 Tax=Mycena indigotica TaxID=2126181 RepID=A0A8H6SCD9_9AGAR|nr:uncharacterized protein MIND_00928100 [Mycena indigotica]KAF7296961.1 hypothetical protein MIND_00928100 [Mycena indigotica]
MSQSTPSTREASLLQTLSPVLRARVFSSRRTRIARTLPPVAAPASTIPASTATGSGTPVVCGAILLGVLHESRSWRVQILPEVAMDTRESEASTASSSLATAMSTGCGAVVHSGAAVIPHAPPSRRARNGNVNNADIEEEDRDWGGLEGGELACSVVTLGEEYHTSDLRALIADNVNNGSGCGCVARGLGCAVCGNALGMERILCSTHGGPKTSYVFLHGAVSPIAPNSSVSIPVHTRQPPARLQSSHLSGPILQYEPSGLLATDPAAAMPSPMPLLPSRDQVLRPPLLSYGGTVGVNDSDLPDLDDFSSEESFDNDDADDADNQEEQQQQQRDMETRMQILLREEAELQRELTRLEAARAEILVEETRPQVSVAPMSALAARGLESYLQSQSRTPLTAVQTEALTPAQIRLNAMRERLVDLRGRLTGW